MCLRRCHKPRLGSSLSSRFSTLITVSLHTHSDAHGFMGPCFIHTPSLCLSLSLSLSVSLSLSSPVFYLCLSHKTHTCVHCNTFIAPSLVSLSLSLFSFLSLSHSISFSLSSLLLHLLLSLLYLHAAFVPDTLRQRYRQ